MQCIYIYSECTSVIAGLEFRVTSAHTNASTLYGECNLPLLAGLYSGLPQRIPKNLLYTVNVPLLAGSTIFRVTSAYTNASTLYGECTYNSWTIFRVISAYTNASILYSVNAPIIAGLYTRLPQRIPMHLLYRR